MRTLIPLLFLLAAPPVHAETHEEIVERAFASMEFNLRDYWSFTETTQSADGLFVARFDPRLPDDQRWDLISVDDRKPTEDEHETFREGKGNHGDDDSSEGGSEFRSMVAEGSLELLEESEHYWEYRFRPNADSDDEEELMKAVDGTLRVEKDGHYVTWLRMRNREPVKPGRGVKLDVFDVRMAFAPAYVGGPVLPESVSTSIKGKAMLVIKFDEEERVSYSDFERVIE